MLIVSRFLAGCIAIFCLLGCTRADGEGNEQLDRDVAIKAMKLAATYFHDNVASHGGYVYHYSLDLKKQWGEGVASRDQIWVQPPGTPTVGMAYLKAFEATGDRFYLDAAIDAGNALCYGQLKSGGWTSAIDFDLQGKLSGDYRNGRGRGKNYSTLDDGKSQAAIEFLIHLDKATGFVNESIHESASFALDSLVKAQFSNGGFPQAWPCPPGPEPGLAATYPDYDWRTERRVKEYWFLCTLNDNVAGDLATTLLEADRVYQAPRYRQSLRRLGDFLLLAQMPGPQPGFAQQYTTEMKPAWARKFEPPAIASDETQETIATLMLIAQETGDDKYLRGIPAAMQWLRRSVLPDGSLARYYELKTNRPLFMQRSGDEYFLTYDDSNLPSHYAWKIKSQIDSLAKQYARATDGKPLNEEPSDRKIAEKAKSILADMDTSGRWRETFGENRVVGQLKLARGEQYLSSQTFSDNLATLSRFIARTKK